MLMHFDPNILRPIKVTIVEDLRGQSSLVMPDLVRHPASSWIPAPAPDSDPGFAGMTALGYLVAGAIGADTFKRYEGL